MRDFSGFSDSELLSFLDTSTTSSSYDFSGFSDDDLLSFLGQEPETPAVAQPQETVEPGDEYEGVALEFIEGIGSGLIGIGEGIAETAALGIDLIADSDLATDVREGAQGLRDFLGIDPVGLVGKGTEALTQFAVPGIAAASAVSKFSRLGKLQKALSERRDPVTRAGVVRTQPATRGLGTDSVRDLSRGLTGGQRAALGAQQLATAGLVDAVVATNNISTIGDFFEGGPTQTNRTEDLTGRDEAFRRIENKLKIGLESSTAFGAISGALAGAGAAARTRPGQVATRATAKALQAVPKAVGRRLDEIERVNVFEKAQPSFFSQLLANLRPRGFLPQEAANIQQLLGSQIQAGVKGAEKTFTQIEKTIGKISKELAKRTDGQTPLDEAKMLDTVYEWLAAPKKATFQYRTKSGKLVKKDLGVANYKKRDGKIVYSGVNKELDNALRSFATDDLLEQIYRARGQIDRLSKDISEGPFVRYLASMDQPTGAFKSFENVQDTIRKSFGEYFRTDYKIFRDANFAPSQEVLQQAAKGYKNTPAALKRELSAIKRANKQGLLSLSNRESSLIDRVLTKDGKAIKKKVSEAELDEVSNLAARQMVNRFKGRVNKLAEAAKKPGEKGRVPIDKLNVNILKKRERLESFEKDLLGINKNPRQAFLKTVADLEEFKAVDEFYGFLANMSGQSKVFGKYIVPKEQAPDNFIKLDASSGTDFGVLADFAVPRAVYNNLTRKMIQSDESVIAQTANAAYGLLLRGKGLSQYSKTVLSPVTQVRNVTTASMFALAQGNVGTGANVFESLGMLIRQTDGANPGRLNQVLEEALEQGVIGTQAQLREIQALFKSKGLSSTEGTRQLDEFGELGEEFGETSLNSFMGKIGDTTIAQAGKAVGKKAESLYQGGDDIWKLYNYVFEKNKLTNALRNTTPEQHLDTLVELRKMRSPSLSDVQIRRQITDEGINAALKKEAAEIVRNNIPNYTMVPQAIKDLRQLPLGNFIAFPYEIYRTGFNTLARSLDEMASKNAEIQQIGLRRFMGGIGTFSILPSTVAAIAYQNSGVTEDQMKAYQRTFAPPYEKNSLLIPTGMQKNGLPSYINFSYSNPYDQLARAYRAVGNAIETQQELGRGVGAQVTNAGIQAVAESFAPFFDTSIITEKGLDVLVRDGRTRTGARVYDSNDLPGDKVAKSFMHIVDGLMPSAIPVNIKEGRIEPARFARGVFGTETGEGLLGIRSTDNIGNERTLTKEFARAFTGITEAEPDPKKVLNYKAQEFKNNRRQASNIFNRRADDEGISSEDLFQAYVNADEMRYRLFSEMHQTFEDLETLGFSQAEILAFQEKANVGDDAASIISNVYVPLSISDQTISNMVDAGTFDRFDFSAYANYRAERTGIPFLSADEPEEIESMIPEELPLTSPEAPAAAPLPTAIAPQASLQPAQMTPDTRFFLPGTQQGIFSRGRGVPYSTIQQAAQDRGTTPDELIQTAGLQPIDPQLLGSNPLEQARNLELAQRTRRSV